MILSICSEFYQTGTPHFSLEGVCPSIQFFWQKLISWWNEKGSENVALRALDILYGYRPESNILQALKSECH